MESIEQLLRRVSLCHRVQWGLALAGALVGLQAGLGAWWAAQQGVAAATWGAWLASWGAVGAALAVLGWLSASSIRRPVEDTVQCVVRLAKGDLHTRIESPGRDELSWLRHELNSMRKQLGKLVLEVRESADAVQLASGEIAQGNGDLSQRTELQAGVLQQTASSMQMFTDGVRRSASHVTEAHTLAVSSGEVARRGARLMSEVEQGMAAIDASSRRIHDIIGSIDGIAFQTNLLALNAAVEAARAGEHGRGFAVVAAEVRALAGRSSAAAREIKQLIGESSERVDAGARLVGDAGHTMREILDSVGRVSQLVGELADVGRSQHHDVDEVLGAVSQIDRATQQNAALVEQMAAAAQSLSGQATRMAETVGRFRVTA